MLKAAIPVFRVSRSLDAETFYCEKLGFRREFLYRPTEASDPCYMGIARDNIRLHLSSFEGDSVSGAGVFVVVDDVASLYQEMIENGVTIDMAPTDQPWGNREMYVRDDDRNKIAFVQLATE